VHSGNSASGAAVDEIVDSELRPTPAFPAPGVKSAAARSSSGPTFRKCEGGCSEIGITTGTGHKRAADHERVQAVRSTRLYTRDVQLMVLRATNRCCTVA